MRKLASIMLATVVLAACQDNAIQTGPAISASVSGAAAQTYVVVFRPGVPDVQGLASTLVAAHGGTLRFTYTAALHGFAATLPDAAIAALQRNPNVESVTPDQVVTADATELNATWGLDRVDQVNLPLNGTYNYARTGSGVRAYIIDTGIRTTHSEFGGRASGAYTAINDGNGTNDCNGHGTHVSGTVGGTTYGIAKQVRLYAVRVLDCTGSGFTSGVIAGVDWVTANAIKPAVANMSLGGGAYSPLDQAVANSVAAGIVYAVAAGNSNADACLSSPSREPSALTVGATTSSDARASFSNFGTCLDLFAPGVGITSAWNTSDVATNTISGTSMATPHVTGVAALYLEANPTATPAQVASALTGNADQGLVTSAGTGSPNRLLYSGFLSAPPPPPPPPGPVVVRIAVSPKTVTVPEGTSQQFTVTARFSDSTNGTVPVTWRGHCGAVDGTGLYTAATTCPVGITVPVWATTAAGLADSARVTLAAAPAPPPPPPPPPTNNPPVASFTATCTYMTCTLDGTGSTDDGSIASWAWSTGNPASPSRTGSVATVTYPTPGNWTVTLTVTDNTGLTGSLTKTVTTVNRAPVASFATSCTRLQCTFDGTGSTDDGTIASYAWSTGNPSQPSATGSVVNTAYPSSGTWTVTLTVTDNFGATGSLTKTVTTLDNRPVASFTTSCSYMTCTLDGSGSTDDGTIVSYAWSTGNPASPTATGKVASTTYPGAGSYSVTLTVTDDAGQASSVTNTVTTVDNPPVADFTWSCASFTCTLDGRSSTDDGQIVQYFWTLDRYPGPTATGSVVSVFYWHASTRNVTLTVTDNSGKTASVTKVVTVQ